MNIKNLSINFIGFSKSNYDNAIFIVDATVFDLYAARLQGCKCVIVQGKERSKSLATVKKIIAELITFKADRKSTLVAVGGGVVTDITGYVASVYMRGITFGFVPTTLLAMVDAAIGGKNGVNFGLHKNFIGTINQPSFINIDMSFLKTLPLQEWKNGFAEIIKHACIKDEKLYNLLKKHDLTYFTNNPQVLLKIIKKNINIKLGVVKKDVLENGERKHLNFGHTLGHAIETVHKISHGKAVAIGMCFAAELSAQIFQFDSPLEVKELIHNYELPTRFNSLNKEKVLNILMMDKKKENELIHFVLLTNIGKAETQLLDKKQIEIALHKF
jgi:3-dehydroquinate synthase